MHHHGHAFPTRPSPTGTYFLFLDDRGHLTAIAADALRVAPAADGLGAPLSGGAPLSRSVAMRMLSSAGGLLVEKSGISSCESAGPDRIWTCYRRSYTCSRDTRARNARRPVAAPAFGLQPSAAYKSFPAASDRGADTPRRPPRHLGGQTAALAPVAVRIRP